MTGPPLSPAILAAQLRACADSLDEFAPLPLPDHSIDSIGDHGQDTRTPVWVFESGVQLDGAESVAAWTDGVTGDGDLSSGSTVDAIERDAWRLLAAVAEHRRLAAPGGGRS